MQPTNESLKKAAEQTRKTATILNEVTQHNTADTDGDLQVAADMEYQSQQLNEYVNKLIRLVKGQSDA